MGIDVQDYQSFTINDFSGGLNEEASSYQVADNELVDCENISLRDSGAIKSRLGEIIYHQASGTPIATPVKGMHRYTKSDGTKKVLIYSGTVSGVIAETGKVFADSDDGVFDGDAPIAEGVLTRDGFCRFAQYSDVVLFGTDRTEMLAYNAGESPEVEYVDITPKRYDLGWLFTHSTADAGGYLESKNYLYRFSWDIFHGDVFLGETCLEHKSPENNLGSANYMQLAANLTGLSGTDNVVQIKKSASATTFPTLRKRLNIYRSDPLSSFPDNISVVPDANFFLIGSITKDDYDAASAGDVVFSDDGSVALGRPARYGRMYFPPRARFRVIHKNILWLANVSYYANSDLTTKQQASGLITAPHRVFFSDIDGSLPEPIAFYPDAWVDIDPTTGEGITGLISYRNQLLVVFKANSMWGILGDNRNNLSVRNIDPNIGCVAPETISILEGNLVWLSNRGVYYWNGTTSPRPLNTEKVKKTLLAIPPDRKNQACGIGYTKESEYWLAISHPDALATTGAGGTYNNYVMRYNTKTKSWARDYHTKGISSFLEKKEATEQMKLLGGMGSDYADFALYGVINEMDVGYKTGPASGLNGPADIDWHFKTKFFDGGLPFVEKNFVAVLVQMSSVTNITMDVFCDDRLDTTESGETNFTLSAPSATWDLHWWDGGGDATDPNDPEHADNEHWNTEAWPTVWAKFQEATTLRMLDDRCWGKRIAFKFSGSNHNRPVEIQQITVFYKPVEGEET
jgi:hypothetical protein